MTITVSPHNTQDKHEKSPPPRSDNNLQYTHQTYYLDNVIGALRLHTTMKITMITSRARTTTETQTATEHIMTWRREVALHAVAHGPDVRDPLPGGRGRSHRRRGCRLRPGRLHGGQEVDDGRRQRGRDHRRRYEAKGAGTISLVCHSSVSLVTSCVCVCVVFGSGVRLVRKN